MADDPWAEFRIKPAQEQQQSVAPNNTVPGTPPGGVGPNIDVGSGMEPLNPLKEYARQQKAEDERRNAEATAMVGIQAKDRETAYHQAASALETKKLLSVFKQIEKMPETNDIYTGPAAPVWLALGQTARGILPEGAGESIFPSKGAVSSAELMQKLGVTLATAATKDLTSRPAVFEFMQNIATSPGMLIQPDTRRALTDILDKHTDRYIELGNHALDPDKSYKEYAKEKNRIYNDPKYEFKMPEHMMTKQIPGETKDTIKLPNGQTVPRIRRAP